MEAPAVSAEGGDAVDARRARFREAVAGLAGRARSAELARLLLLPGALLLVFGFGLMLLGWWGAAHTHRQVEQLPYLISGGLVGLACVGVGALLLTSAVWMTVLQRLVQQQDERTTRQLVELEVRLRTEAATAASPAVNGRSRPLVAGRARTSR